MLSGSTGTAMIGWPLGIAGRLPPLRPGLALRALGWADGRRLLRAHRRLVAGLLMAGILTGVVGAVTARPPVVAEALLMIGDDDLARGAAAATDAAPLQGDIALLHGDAIANRLVQQIGVVALFPDLAAPHLFGLRPPAPAAEQMHSAAFRAQQRISAVAGPGAGLLRVSYADPDRAIALGALRTVIAAYLQLRVNLVGDQGASRMVARDSEQTAGQLREIDTEIQKLRADYQIIDIEQDSAAATARLDDILRRESQVRERQRAVQAELDSAGGALQASPPRVFDAQETSARPLEEARAALLALRLERDHMATQYAPTFPALIELDRKIASAQQILQQSAKPLVSATRDVRNPALDTLRNRSNDLQIEAAGLAQQHDALGLDYEHAINRVAELREADGRMHDLQYRRSVLEAVGRQISVREMSLRVDDSVAQARRARVHVIQAPGVAPEGLRSWPLWLAAGTLGGLCAAGLGGVLASRLRRTYVLGREVERHLDLPVLAEFDADDVVLNQLSSQRQVAAIAALLADARVDNRPLFSLQAVTPDADADQRAVMQSLAAELGGRFGLRTLLLDVGADGVALPLALEGPGLTTPLPDRLAGASLPLWNNDEDMPGESGAEPGPVGEMGSARRDTPLALHAALSFTAQTLATLQQSCDLVLLVAGGEASGEASRRLARHVDATLLVVAAETTSAVAARSLSRSVTARGGQLLGAVMTGRCKPALMW